MTASPKAGEVQPQTANACADPGNGAGPMRPTATIADTGAKYFPISLHTGTATGGRELRSRGNMGYDLF
jgi:hypothetical protein